MIDALAILEAELLGPGGPFETEEAVVLGERVRVFRHRPRDLRALLERSASFGDAEYLISATGGRPGASPIAATSRPSPPRRACSANGTAWARAIAWPSSAPTLPSGS